MNRIVIGRLALDKIMYYVRKTKYEISGMGIIENIDGVPTVVDIVLLKQINEKTETELNANAIAKADYNHFISKKSGELKFWWHSHNTMDAYWSKTDYEAMDLLTGDNGWFFHGVFNHKGDTQFAYTDTREFNICIDDIPMEVNEYLVSEELYNAMRHVDNVKKKLKKNMEENCDAQYIELVTEKKYSAVFRGMYPSGHGTDKVAAIGGEHWSDDEWCTEWREEGKRQLLEEGYTPTQIWHLRTVHDIIDLHDIDRFEDDILDSVENYLIGKGIK